MKDDELELGKSVVRDYDRDRRSGNTVPGEWQVIVPPAPPEFGPVAARAFLRLILAVSRKRAEKPISEPSEGL